MIVVKNKNGEFKYSNLSWNLAWFVVWLLGLITGILIR